MKRATFLMTSLVLPLLSASQTVPDSLFELRICTEKVSSDTRVYLLYQQNGKRFIDSAFQKHGTYVLKGIAHQPIFATIVADHRQEGIMEIMTKDSADFIQLYLHPGRFVLQASGKIADARFSGSIINSDNLRLQEMLKGITTLRKHLSKQLMATRDKQTISDLRRQLDSLKAAEKPILKRFILGNPDSFIALTALQVYAGVPPDPEIILPMFEKLSPVVRAGIPAREFHQFLMSEKSLVAGAKAPEFTQGDTAGKPVSLSSFRGKYVLLDFWASWCGPCRQESPGLRQIHEDFKKRNFTILGISLDRADGRSAWLRVINEDRLAWTHVADLKQWDNQVAKLYGIRRIPQNFLVDPNGIIIARNLNQSALRKKLEEILPAK